MKTIPHIVLYADDDPDDQQLMREIIEQIDDQHQLVEASNGQHALEYLYRKDQSSELPCLIILDINMPLLNGWETLERLKTDERLQSIPVVVFTTSTAEKDRTFCRQHGVPIFTKPTQYKDFKEVVRNLLSHCAQD